MTLYRQIAILVTIIFVILFITIITVSFNVIKDSVQKELYENAQNNVSTLSLSISNTSISESNIQTMINATFDNGNYERITFKNLDGETKYQIDQENIIQDGVPLWFKNIVEIQIPVAKATLSSNWRIIGLLEIINDKNSAYLQLYKVMTNISLYLSISCIIFLITLYYVFHIILKPLLNIQKQASAVMNNEFIIQKELPKTKEFRTVIKSINSMIKKFESIFQTANETLSKNKELLYTDSVMNIPNRKYFVLKANEYLEEDSEKNIGTAIIISIIRADLLNQLIGYINTDKFMYELAQYIKIVTKDFEEVLVCRLNGTEIIIMLPTIKADNISFVPKEIFSYTDMKLEAFGLKNRNDLGVYIGISEYKELKKMSELFSLVDYSLVQAKLLSSKVYYTVENKEIAIGKDNWRENILKGLNDDKFEIIYREVKDFITKEKLHNSVSFILKVDSQIYSYGEFIAPVVDLGLLGDVYLYVIKKVLLSNDCEFGTTTTIQLSSNFLNSVDTYQKLKYLFEELKNQVKGKIIFEISETLINNHYETILLFIKLFKEYGFSFAINNFIADSEDYQYLKELRPSFVKAEKQYLLDMEQNINVLKIILESLNIKLIATGVNNLEELNQLEQKQITIISGRIVDNFN